MSHAVRAFSLPEMMIATAISATLLGAVMMTLSAVQDYSRLGDAQDDLVNEGRAIQRQFETDLSLSGWYLLSALPTTMTGTGGDRDSRYYPYIQIQSSNGDPWGTSLGAGLGQQFPHHKRAAGLVLLPSLPSGLPGSLGDSTRDFDTTSLTDLEQWRTSFYARSQEIIFLRARQGDVLGEEGFVFFDKDNTDAWTKAPSATTASGLAPHEALSLLKMEEWCRAAEVAPALKASQGVVGSGSDPETYYRLRNGRTVYDVVLKSAFYDSTNADVLLNWETTEPLDSTPTAVISGSWSTVPAYVNVANRLIHTAILTEYTYCVVPSSSGFGRLVRARKARFGSTAPTVVTSAPAVGHCIAAAIDPDASNTPVSSQYPYAPLAYYGLVVDKVLSDNVVRVVFDTMRTARPVHADDTATLGSAAAALVKQEALDINQVRVRLFLAKRLTSEQMAHHRLETTVTLRARSGIAEVEADRALLPTSPALAPLPR